MEFHDESHSRARKRAIRKIIRRQGNSGIRTRRHPDRQRQGGRGDRSRVQAYEGVCIGRSGSGLNESFTVRKISYGEGVERVFPVMSPMIDSIKVVRRGKVRRAKLYYLRNLRGKSARIVEKTERAAAVGE